MDFAGYRYYKLHHVLLSLIGLWAYDNGLMDKIERVFFSVLLTSGVFIQVAVFITTSYNQKLLLECLPYITFAIMFCVKYEAFCLSIRRVRFLIDRIKDDWNQLETEEEFKIIREYSHNGTFITMIFASSIYLSIILIILSQLLPHFLDIIVPLNESRVYHLPTAVEYFVDQKKYLYYILLHIDLVAIVGSTTLVGTEMIFLMFILHTCGMFKVASYRVARALDQDELLKHSDEKTSIYTKMSGAVKMHNRAIEFADFIKSTFKVSYFFVLILGVSAVSFNLYRLSQSLLVMNDIEELSNVLFLLIGQFCYVFVANYAGQIIIDHSNEVFDRAYDTKWYQAPICVQKSLLLVLIRSMRSCYLLIGGIYMPSLEGFSTLSNMSFSYFMVLYSAQ